MLCWCDENEATAAKSLTTIGTFNAAKMNIFRNLIEQEWQQSFHKTSSFRPYNVQLLHSHNSFIPRTCKKQLNNFLVFLLSGLAYCHWVSTLKSRGYKKYSYLENMQYNAIKLTSAFKYGT